MEYLYAAVVGCVLGDYAFRAHDFLTKWKYTSHQRKDGTRVRRVSKGFKTYYRGPSEDEAIKALVKCGAKEEAQ